MGTSYTNQSPHPDMTGYIGQDYFYGNKDTQPHTKVLPHSRKHYHCHSLRHDYSRCHWGCSLLPQLSKYHQHYFPADFLPTAHSVFLCRFRTYSPIAHSIYYPLLSYSGSRTADGTTNQRHTSKACTTRATSRATATPNTRCSLSAPKSQRETTKDGH